MPTKDECQPKVFATTTKIYRVESNGGLMRIRSAATSVALGALTFASLALVQSASAFEKAQMGAPAAAQTQVAFDIYLPLQNKADLLTLEEAQQTPGSPQYHRWLTPA